MRSGTIDWVRISALFGIVASLGGIAGFLFSKDTQRCLGLNGTYRGEPMTAIAHCTDDRSQVGASAAIPGTIVSSVAPVDSNGDPRALGGTRWVFYIGDSKTIVTFDVDGTMALSDATYGTNGHWKLAGRRGVAFHTDTYDFGGTIGRGVPDSFDVNFRHLRRGIIPEPNQTVTFTRL